MPSTAFRAVRASNMQPELCGSVVDRFSGRFQALFAGSWSARVRTFRKHAKLGCSYFNHDVRGNRSSAYNLAARAFWPVTVS